MKISTIILLSLCLLLAVTGVYIVTHIPTPQLLQTNQAIAEKQAEIRLLEAKNTHNREYVSAQKDLQRLRTLATVEAGLLYRSSLAVSLAVKNLWMLWLLVALGIAAYSQRFRLSQQVEFVTGDTKSIIPAKEAVRLTERAIQRQELEVSSKILALEGDNAHRQLQDGIAIARAVKSFGQAEKPVDAIDIEQPALPAFRGNVHLSQLLLDSDYEPGLIPYGRELSTGNIVQVDFETRKTVLKIGLQGTGKTTSTKAEIFAALTMRYEQGQPVRLYLIDAHYGFQQSLATDLRDYLPLFDACVLGKDCLTGGALDLLTRMIEEAETFQTSGTIQPETTDLLWIDEYSELIDTADDGREIEKAVKRLVNLRKAGKYLSLNVYDGSKGNNSNKGLHPAKMACSVMCYRTNETQAGQVLGWQNKDIIRQVPGLEVGQAVLSIPGADMAVVQTCLVSDSDFFRFSKFAQDAANKTDAAVDIDSQEKIDSEADLTAKMCKERRKEFEWTQGDLADRSHVHLSKIKKFESGRNANFSHEEVQALQDTLFPVEKSNVVNFRTRN